MKTVICAIAARIWAIVRDVGVAMRKSGEVNQRIVRRTFG